MSLLGRQLTHKTFSLLLQRAAVHQSHPFRYSTSSSDEENSKGELSSGWRLHTLSGIAFSSQGHQQYAFAGGDSETINFDSKAYRDWVEDALTGSSW